MSVWEHVALEFDNQLAADKLVDEIVAKITKLAEHPGMGVERSELSPGIRLFPVKSHVILYRVYEAEIIISRVLYGGRDLGTLQFPTE